MPSRFMHGVTNVQTSFLWPNGSPLYIYILQYFFIYSSVNGHLRFSHILVILNSATMNMGVHMSFQVSVSFFLG